MLLQAWVLHVARDLLLDVALQGSFGPGFHMWLTICCWFAAQGSSTRGGGDMLKGSGDAANYTVAVRALLPATEPPFIDGDGVDVWDYLSSNAPASPRTVPYGGTEREIFPGRGKGGGGGGGYSS